MLGVIDELKTLRPEIVDTLDAMDLTGDDTTTSVTSISDEELSIQSESLEQDAVQNGPELVDYNWGILDEPTKNGKTLLCSAASHGRADICRILISYGATVDFADGSGTTPLLYAVSRGHLDVVQLLVGCGARVTASNDRDMTPLRASLGDPLRKANTMRAIELGRVHLRRAKAAYCKSIESILFHSGVSISRDCFDLIVQYAGIEERQLVWSKSLLRSVDR